MRCNVDKVCKSEQEWRELLTESEYQICRQKGTERAFTGEFWDSKAQGHYLCRCCGMVLFASDTKYDSGSGWPSFYQAENDTHILEHGDASHGMQRTEVTCARCDSHLGHVFPDGPEPSGLRYCINSASLQLQETES